MADANAQRKRSNGGKCKKHVPGNELAVSGASVGIFRNCSFEKIEVVCFIIAKRNLKKSFKKVTNIYFFEKSKFQKSFKKSFIFLKNPTPKKLEKKNS